MTCCPDAAGRRRRPGIWNPLPCFDTVKQDGQLGNIQTVDHFSAAAKAARCRPCPGSCPNGAVSEHPRRRSARARPT